MTANQEEALYEFLENVTEPFTLDNILSFVRMVTSQKTSRLPMEVATLINSRNIAFRLGDKRWVSRRGCFEPARFTITPTKLELLNGILIPGHRCVPFANPVLMPQELEFHWQGSRIPVTNVEGNPDEFYPYYTIYGEEYAPQYVARDNPDNESAFNDDFFEDMVEVSIHTLDMRSIYRETGFVPGDRFSVSCRDWKSGSFDLKKVGKDEWSRSDLYAWFEAAEAGFTGSFEYLGPGVSTDEQIAFAYWYGGERMRDVPALSLEEFLYEKTERIETVPYGIETRFWYTGREIPDRNSLEGAQTLPDRTYIEETLYRNGVPVSEFVIQSYVRDALFRRDTRIPGIVERIVPKLVRLDSRALSGLADYVRGALDEIGGVYSIFVDQKMGPVRRRAGELHTAVIELSARLLRGETDTSWLPRHTFVVLSQIQGHAAGMLEDLDADEAVPETEIELMENSLDTLVDTYDEIRELVDDALQNHRRNNLFLVPHEDRPGGVFPSRSFSAGTWQVLQISLGGADIWRRLAFPEDFRLDELHRAIYTLFGWKDGPWRFSVTRSSSGDISLEGGLFVTRTIGELLRRGAQEMGYEYSGNWRVKIIFLLGTYPPGEKDRRVRCVAGAGLAPPASVDNPVAYRRLTPFPGGVQADGGDSRLFSVAECNRLLDGAFPADISC